ncbi:GMC family oxidoreductase [Crossiella cryophila]|uniref:Choline dehydrogenase n=1 Tax=Crossiella cryophila TaxID=43355 RepID=A0A7W7CCS4_9PSEU|nr:GMC family oxidoreductase N-terminal domain-containing protein [Crossiella cryophila]MBB4678720.1 choline dehydrogenase [Crossiella cryophila]
MSGVHLPDEVDTIVVGAGTGGAAFTGLLAAHSTETVLLVEAGPDYGHFTDGRWPADVLDAKAIPLSHDWGLSGTVHSGRTLDLPRAKVIGGCSAHNGCTAALGAREDYDEWARLGNPGWDAATVEPLLHWTRDRFRVRRYRMDELTSAQAAFVRAGMSTGLPFADDLDDLEAGVGIGPMPVNIVDGVRWNASLAFLDPVRHRPGLTIAGDTTVRRVLFAGSTAIGVEIDSPDGARTVRAGRVIIACGAYQSPALLLRSGVGPAADLRALDIPVVADLPGVGGHLLDHSCVQLDFHGKDGLLDDLARTPWHPDEQTVGRARSSRCDNGPYDIHVFMVAGANSGHPGLPPISLYGGAMRARSEGRITLRSNDPHDLPRIDHRYGTDPDGYDRLVLSEAAELLRTMTTQPELAAILGREASTGDPLDRIVNYCHPAGSCKMGPGTDPAAVVDARGAVRGLAGLHVADASIMPAISRGNINLPTAMIGARIAAALLDITPVDAVLEQA